MEYLTFIEVKRIVNGLMTRMINEMNSRYDKSSITEFVKKYGCENEREFLRLVCCEIESPDLNISIRETLKNIENESYSLHNDLDFKTTKLIESEGYNTYLKEQLKSFQERIDVYIQQSEYLQHYIKDMELVLQHNNLSFKNEIKKIKPNATPQKPPKR